MPVQVGLGRTAKDIAYWNRETAEMSRLHPGNYEHILNPVVEVKVADALSIVRQLSEHSGGEKAIATADSLTDSDLATLIQPSPDAAAGGAESKWEEESEGWASDEEDELDHGSEVGAFAAFIIVLSLLHPSSLLQAILARWMSSNTGAKIGTSFTCPLPGSSDMVSGIQYIEGSNNTSKKQSLKLTQSQQALDKQRRDARMARVLRMRQLSGTPSGTEEKKEEPPAAEYKYDGEGNLLILTPSGYVSFPPGSQPLEGWDGWYKVVDPASVQPFYFHKSGEKSAYHPKFGTGNSSGKPDEESWVDVYTAQGNYYWNVNTGMTAWSLPQGHKVLQVCSST